MNNSDAYRPINCEVHDGYELACMRRAVHEVCWQDGSEHKALLRFLDLECAQGKEYLIAENQAGERFRIRLDQITSTLPY